MESFVPGERGGLTVPNLRCYSGNKVCRVLLHSFGVVQAHRTSSNLLERQHHKDSKVWRVLSKAFVVVRPYRTFSLYIVTGGKRWIGLSYAFGVV